MPCAASPTTSPPPPRQPSTGGWVSRPRPTASSASGRCRRSTCSRATSTAPAARCSRPRRSTSSGAACSRPVGSAGAGRGCAGCPSFGGELPVSALLEEMTTPGEGQVRALLTIAGNPVSSTPGGHRLDAAISRARRGGRDRLLRQRDDAARRRHPPAGQPARARPLRPHLPHAGRARHGALVAGPVPARGAAPSRTGRSPGTSARR